jgi:hypothetical protein
MGSREMEVGMQANYTELTLLPEKTVGSGK